MKKTLVVLLAIVFIENPIFAGGKVDNYVLSNGLKVIFKRVSDNPLVSVYLFTNNGSIKENTSNAGISNFTQLMLMQGTKKRNAEKLAADLEDIGAGISSDIGKDYTSLNISAISGNFTKAMELFSEIITEPTFPENEVSKEKMNILASIQARADKLSLTAEDLFIKIFYGDHPYSWPDIGKENSVNALDRVKLAEWHKGNYTADNMLLVIIGDVNKSDAKDTAEKYFSKLPKNGNKTVIPAASAPKLQNEILKNKKFKQAYFMIGFPAPELHNKDYAAIKMINAVLGSRMTARLFTELREKLSLAYELNSAYPSRKELSRFIIYIGLDKKNIPLAKSKILEILEDLKKNPISKQELADTQNYIKGVYLLDHQTINKQAWYLGWWEIMGKGYNYDEKYLSDLLSVTPKQMQDAAKQYFNDQFVTVEVVPE